MPLSDIADKDTERYNRVSIIFSIYNMPLSDIADKDTEIKSSNTFYRTQFVYAHIEQNSFNSCASHPGVVSCTLLTGKE